MANTSATLKNPFEGHQDVKTFREQADSAKSKLSSFQSDVQTKIDAASTGYLSAAETSASNWPSDDNTSKEPLAHIGSAMTILLTSVTSDLANIIGDVETVSSNIKDIEDKYDKAKKYVPGCFMKDGHAVSGDVDGAVWNEKDNEKIIKANQELPDLVAEAEKQMQSIADAAGAVKLGIDAEGMKTGNFGNYVGYDNEIVKREGKVSWINSVLSFLAGMADGILNDGEGVLDLVLMGVESLVKLIPNVGESISGVINSIRSLDLADGLIETLVEKFGGDMDAFEKGKKWGQVGTIVGCHMLGPVGNILYGLSVFGKEIKKLQDAGETFDDWKDYLLPLGKGAIAAWADSSLIGMLGLFLFNTDVGTEMVGDVVSNLLGGVGDLLGIGNGSGIGDALGSLWNGAKDLFSSGWDKIKEIFSI